MSARRLRTGGVLTTGLIGVLCLVSLHPGSCGVREWTVVGYFAGDGDLGKAVERYQTQILMGARLAGWNAALQTDRTNRYGRPAASRQLLTWDEDRPVASEVPLASAEGGVDMGAASTLAATLRWAREAAPAEKYALIVLGHGNAVGDGPEGRAAVATDASAANALSPAELAAGLEDGMGGEVVEVVFLDCCHGASLETAFMLRRGAKYMCASGGRVASPGVQWAKVLAAAGESGAADGRELVRQTLIAAGPGGTENEDALRLTGVDLGALDEVAEALSRFVQVATDAIAEIAPVVTEARCRAEAWEPTPAVADASGFFGALGRGTEDLQVAEAALAVSRAVGACQTGGGRGDAAGNGIGIFFPGAFQEIPETYGDSEESLPAATGWSEFIQAYGDRLRGLLDRAASGEVSLEAQTAG